jgi:hypothetical protein
MRRRGGRWTEVVEAFWKQIPPIKDGSIGKGIGVDIRSLKGSYGVYGGTDGNCCPSREILLELEQRSDSLVLKNYHVRASPSEGSHLRTSSAQRTLLNRSSSAK